jgi:hypothetical protein
MRECQPGENEREQHGHNLRDNYYAVTTAPVRHGAAYGREKKYRNLRSESDQPE